GDDTAIRSTRHGRQHGRETRIASEDFQDHEALMGAGGSAQGVGHLNGSGNTGAGADAIVGAGHVIVHGLGNGYDAHALLVEAHAIAEGIVAADGDEVFHAQPGEVLQDFGRQIVLLGVVFALQVVRNTIFADAAGIGARRV